MSTARERLVEAATKANDAEVDAFWKYAKEHPRKSTTRRDEDTFACGLDAFLAHPDDLLEVLVEAGVLEIVLVGGVISGAKDWMVGEADLYRRGDGA